MYQHNILITGAFSGIGKEFVRTYVKHRDSFVTAIDKDFPDRS